VNGLSDFAGGGLVGVSSHYFFVFLNFCKCLILLEISFSVKEI